MVSATAGTPLVHRKLFRVAFVGCMAFPPTLAASTCFLVTMLLLGDLGVMICVLSKGRPVVVATIIAALAFVGGVVICCRMELAEFLTAVAVVNWIVTSASPAAATFATAAIAARPVMKRRLRHVKIW